MEDRASTLRNMQICRFCLSDDVDLTNIYEKINKDKLSVPLPLQIMACLSIEVFTNDGMPQLICVKCRKLTLQAYAFKTNAKKADDTFKVFMATGELTKPYLKPIHMRQEIPNAEKNIAKIIKRTSQTSSEGPPKKIVKTHQKSEIITLNFDTNSSEQIVAGTSESNDPESSIELDVNEDDPPTHEYYEEENSNDESGPVAQVKTDIFPCPHCQRSFPLKQLLDLHVVNHERERLFKCDICDRKFFSKYDLNTHVQTHVGEKPYECVVCQKTFSRVSLLHRHEKIHTDVPQFICTECDRSFLNQANLDVHMEKHNKKRPFSCSICNKSFVFKQGLERHELVHSENKPHKCNYCEASFNSAIKLTRHITSHAGLRPYPCKLCGRTFLMSHHLTRHMRSHYAVMSAQPEKSIGEYKCDICSMSFRRKDFLINHSAIHSMVNLKCVICNTKFENAREVKEHITTHLSDLAFPCEKCDYSFETQDQLEEHELKHAEMEYEVQIEQEVIAEAKQAEEEEYEEDNDDIEEFVITDMNNPEFVRREKPKPTNIMQFLKDEMISDEDDQLLQQEQEMEMDNEVPEAEIKPIVRTEGTKVYTRRKESVSKKQSTFVAQSPDKSEEQTNLNSLINQQINIPIDGLQQLGTKKLVNMKMGEKVVRVQKYILTKDEMKAMAKKGLLEMKGNTVILKTPGRPILNATLKSLAPDDLEALMDTTHKQKPKTYQRKITQDGAQINAPIGSQATIDVPMRYEEPSTSETAEIDEVN